MYFSHQTEQKPFIKANCTNNIHTGEKVFYNYYIWRFVCCYFSVRVRKLHNLACMYPLYISREEINKQILFTKGKFSFLYVDIEFDVVKCKFILKKGQLKMFDVFLPIFVVYTKIIFGCNFVVLLTTRK